LDYFIGKNKFYLEKAKNKIFQQTIISFFGKQRKYSPNVNKPKVEFAKFSKSLIFFKKLEFF
jgi:hypothetical protein